MSTLDAFSHAAQASSVDTTPALIKTARSLKNLVREAHPFARKPAYLKPHPVAWEFYTAQFGRAARSFGVAAALFCGWPFAMKWAIDYSNGVYDPPRRRGGGSA